MTTPERHNRVYELFAKARELDGEKRRALLDEACAGDPGLRAEVEDLLEKQGELPGFLEEPHSVHDRWETRSSDRPGATIESEPDRDQPPLTIEGFEIVRELYRGGQGIVYQALQKATKRKVAIKVLREGPFATKSAKIRFEREIEFVAQLKHPNIITIFDSGTTPAGWQYYVMDYVRGLPLNRHVRENHLTVEETLNIFSRVCSAVQYAHHRGVIHRDLKPSNILIDSEGDPKILDFGLAKQLLGPIETIVSISQEVIGTLPYMSPEQAKGNPDHIDTRTDIYALGVILYETLTGHYPYPVAGHMAEVLKHIAETPPTPPSRQWTPDSGVTQRSAKLLRAGKCPITDDLQTVILKTLAKERERRYQSAGDLAEDISHYLANEPIEAKRDSSWYVFRKGAVRHKAKIGVITVFAAIFAVFGLYTRHQSAQTAAADAQRARLDRASELYDEAAALHGRERYADAKAKCDAALTLVPDHFRSLGLRAYALERMYAHREFGFRDDKMLREVMQSCERALQLQPQKAGLRNLLGVLRLALDDSSGAVESFRAALKINPSYHPALTNLAKALAVQGKYEEALNEAARGADVLRQLKTTDEFDEGVLRVLGTIQLYLGRREAYESLTEARNMDSRDFRNLLLLARLHLTLPEHKDAKTAFELAKDAVAYTGLSDPRFKRILAQAALRVAEHKDAARYATAAAGEGDEPAYCHLIAAIAEARLGNVEKAEELVASAKESWPEGFAAGKNVIVTVEKQLLWFDTLAELNGLLAEAESLVQP